jgi:hypothetical protein
MGYNQGLRCTCSLKMKQVSRNAVASVAFDSEELLGAEFCIKTAALSGIVCRKSACIYS